eukprot:TRINITY_DN515_c0_g1_i2.p1 TRINITY_DN515_c0_g1~~TRINITY_DN515_c0_g1_i2.p1  ORF type:complete len:198 (+),score=73.96 TRINITY_DN515_c0_g1_i2:395-988(+)
MKPAWDRLMADYSDSASSVVGDVDCTVEEDLCSKHNVEGYPTIKHGDPSALEDYTGGREYEDLADFAKGNLGPTCGLKSLDQCSDQEKKDIEQAQALSNDQLLDTLNKTKEAIRAAELEFDSGVAALEKKFEELSTSKEAKIKEINAAVSPPVKVLQMVGQDRGLAVSYTHLRAHETVLDLVCRLLLEKKKHNIYRC